MNELDQILSGVLEATEEFSKQNSSLLDEIAEATSRREFLTDLYNRTNENRLLDEIASQTEKINRARQIRQQVFDRFKDGMGRLIRGLGPAAGAIFTIDFIDDTQRRLIYTAALDKELQRRSEKRRRYKCATESVSECVGKGGYSISDARNPALILDWMIDQLKERLNEIQFHNSRTWVDVRPIAREWIKITNDLIRNLEYLVKKGIFCRETNRHQCRKRVEKMKTRCVRKVTGQTAPGQ